MNVKRGGETRIRHEFRIENALGFLSVSFRGGGGVRVNSSIDE